MSMAGMSCIGDERSGLKEPFFGSSEIRLDIGQYWGFQVPSKGDRLESIQAFQVLGRVSRS